MAGTAFAIAQNGPPTGGYPPAGKNPNYYGYYGYYAGPRYASPRYYGGPHYRLGYPVPSYGYRGSRGWWW
jgi:hypothetical protein